ncbi:MAG: hypothetical protein AAFY60_12305, partial [Myxococcota bacterium]
MREHPTGAIVARRRLVVMPRGRVLVFFVLIVFMLGFGMFFVLVLIVFMRGVGMFFVLVPIVFMRGLGVLFVLFVLIVFMLGFGMFFVLVLIVFMRGLGVLFVLFVLMRGLGVLFMLLFFFIRRVRASVHHRNAVQGHMNRAVHGGSGGFQNTDHLELEVVVGVSILVHAVLKRKGLPELPLKRPCDFRTDHRVDIAGESFARLKFEGLAIAVLVVFKVVGGGSQDPIASNRIAEGERYG